MLRSPPRAFITCSRGAGGESYVVFGSADPFAAEIELSDLDGGNGFTLRGEIRRDFAGGSVSGAGDVNGDGYDDLIIGAEGADPAGESYVVFGSGDPFDAVLQPSALDGGNGFTVLGGAREVSSAGDINGDGYDDLIIGASSNYSGRPGMSHVVFGSGDPFDAVIELADLDGTNGFAINGIDVDDRSGESVSGAGDINGDGYDDIIIGAPFANANGILLAGESYVVFGSSAPFDAVIELSDLDGGNGFVLNGIDAGDRSGFSVSGAGDVNGDGYDDLIIGARYADPNGARSAGESYVVFGSGDPFDASFELSDLDGTNGFVLNGIDRDDYSGFSVSGAGDVNNDGYDDLIIGAPGAEPEESYVVFGGADIGAGGALAVDLVADLTGDDPLLL